MFAKSVNYICCVDEVEHHIIGKVIHTLQFIHHLSYARIVSPSHFTTLCHPNLKEVIFPMEEQRAVTIAELNHNTPLVIELADEDE